MKKLDSIKGKKPVVLLTGYLGSGKTTVMNNLLSQEKRKIALIVNDMGSVNVDAKLLAKGSKVKEAKMYELSNGCICCTLRDEFLLAVEEIARENDVEAIFVEASGISDPSSIAAGFLYGQQEGQIKSAYLSSVVTVVDASRIHDEFISDLEKISTGKLDVNGLSSTDIITLIMDQIEFCNTILLNKCDLVSHENLEKVKSVIQNIQTEAEIIETTNGAVDIDRIVNGKPFDYDKVQGSSSIEKALEVEPDNPKVLKKNPNAAFEEYGISSFVFEARKPFDRKKFTTFMQEEYPEELIRAKGYMWFSDDDVQVQLFEQAGRNCSIMPYAVWIAAMEDSVDKKELMENYSDDYFAWDENYGDRMNQLVFIGKGFDEKQIRQRLNDCLAA